MGIYYVATLARYVLVEAESPSQARELGHPALPQLILLVLVELCHTSLCTGRQTLLLIRGGI